MISLNFAGTKVRYRGDSRLRCRGWKHQVPAKLQDGRHENPKPYFYDLVGPFPVKKAYYRMPTEHMPMLNLAQTVTC